MKLLYITNGINGSGGLERAISIKASILANEYGYDISVLCLNEGHKNPFYHFSPRLNIFSINVSGNPISYYLAYKKNIQRVVDELKPDVISVCDDGLKGFFIPSIVKTNAQIIYERHASINLNTDNSIKGKLMRKLMRKQVEKFQKFIVLTEGNVAEWEKDNVIVIPNPLGFQTDRKSNQLQKRVIVVGSHSYNKGYDMLVDIWEEIEKEFPDWRLNVFGKIDADKTFLKLAQQKNLKNIVFHEPVKDIISEYLNSSILLLPSRSEGFGMVLIEAMECGVPCIAFDCPSGPRDIISDTQDGFLVPALDTTDFIKKLKLLISDEDLRINFGIKAKENSKRYEASRIVQKWDALFKELVA